MTTNDIKKGPRGGRREGAGRKTTDRKVSVSVRLGKQDLESIGEVADRSGFIREAIDVLRERREEINERRVCQDTTTRIFLYDTLVGKKKKYTAVVEGSSIKVYDGLARTPEIREYAVVVPNTKRTVRIMDVVPLAAHRAPYDTIAQKAYELTLINLGIHSIDQWILAVEKKRQD